MKKVAEYLEHASECRALARAARTDDLSSIAIGAAVRTTQISAMTGFTTFAD